MENFKAIEEFSDPEDFDKQIKCLMIRESNKILKTLKFVISLSYCAGCWYSPYILCFRFDGVRPFEWTAITLWLIEILVGLMVVPKFMEPPYIYKRLALHNIKNADMIFGILITVLALIFSCIDKPRVVHFIFCFRIFQATKLKYALEKLLKLVFLG